MLSYAPVIGSLLTGPDPVIEGAALHLVAAEVGDEDGDPLVVQFYRNADGNGHLNPGHDQLLGTGVPTETPGVWKLNVSSAGFGQGTVRYFARAVNDKGKESDTATVVGHVGLYSIADNGHPGFTASGAGWTTVANTADYGGGHAQHAAGDGTATAVWQFDGLPAAYYRLGVTWTASTALAPDALFSVYNGTQLIAQVTVNQRRAPGLRPRVSPGSIWPAPSVPRTAASA